MDVESLFTNVPVDETIDLITDRVNRDDSTPSLNIPEPALRTLLAICTKRAPFTPHRGHTYLQNDGVAMSSPLGVLFANFYMGVVEERVFSRVECPFLYLGYIDDTFVKARSSDEIETLRKTFEDHSLLRFTLEHSQDNRLPFLDVLVTSMENGFGTTVYTKPTNLGMCLNGGSECPTRYKSYTIKAYVRRALSHCSTWCDTHKELDRISQVLVNNGVSNMHVQKEVRKAVDKWYEPAPAERPDSSNNIKLFYKGHMHPNYLQDEKAMKEIIKNNVFPTEDTQKLDFIIYYQTAKTKSLIMKNNPAPLEQDFLKKTNVVYAYQCPFRGCPRNYIGMKNMRLSRRISCHTQQGAIKNHCQ
ncbi:uncharacterized protein [Palaemon carinicauda]|uniref:uncharacterized protein n=1 Tax=Palaemon carinicauda TaxID=392227 RepID=UPI0035B653FB